MKSPPQSSNCGNGLGITRLCDPPGSKLQKHFAGRNGRMEHAQAIAAPAPKKSCFIQSKDLFDDDDDDLLIAVANEVESQFGKKVENLIVKELLHSSFF